MLSNNHLLILSPTPMKEELQMTFTPWTSKRQPVGHRKIRPLEYHCKLQFLKCPLEAKSKVCQFPLNPVYKCPSLEKACINTAWISKRNLSQLIFLFVEKNVSFTMESAFAWLPLDEQRYVLLVLCDFSHMSYDYFLFWPDSPTGAVV